MRYGSVCSGIEAATTAWHPLGWEPQFFSEIEPFPCAVLAHHYPDVPNYGDMTKFKEWPDAAIDVLVGGTPCQSYSVAGLRAGLDDPRGNLMLTYVAIARRYRPRWVCWENVPGVLSSNEGRDFGSFLGLLTGQHIECPPGGWRSSGVVPGYKSAYGIAWRVLDAQYFGVPQRRRRVFVVGYLGDWRRAAAVLFERHSLQGHTPPSRKAGAGIASHTARSLAIRGRDGTPQAELGNDVANTILTPNGGRAGVGCGAILETVSALTANGVGTCGTDDNQGQAGYLIPAIAGTLKANNGGGGFGSEPSETFIPVSFANAGYFGAMKEVSVADSLRAKGGETIICMSTGQASAEIGIGIGTTLNCNHEAPIVTHTLRGEGFDASEDGTGRGTPLVAVPLQEVGKRTGTSTNDPRAGIGIGADGDPMYTLQAGAQHGVAVAFDCKASAGFMPDPSEIAPTLRSMSGKRANGGGQIAVAFAENSRAEIRLEGGDGSRCGALSAGGGKPGQGVPMVFNLRGREGGAMAEMAEMAEMASLRSASGGSSRSYVASSVVRRLTPRECELLQGFPVDYTLIPNWQKIKNVRPEKLDHDYLKYLARGGKLTYEECIKAATDGPRYKSLGNSMNTDCMKWLGERIQMVDNLEV